MSRRRLLIFCYFFPPLGGGGVHRVLGFTRHLPDHGWDCTVVCADAGDYWVSDESLLALVRPETEVIRVAGGSALSAWLKWRGMDRGQRSGAVFSGLRFLSDWWLLPDSYVGWARRAAARGEKLLSSRPRGSALGFDAVLSSSPPDSVHLAALRLRRRFATPWVADFRDPWIGLHFRDPPTPWHKGRQRRLEAAVLGSADLILTASRADQDRLLHPGPGSALPAHRVVHLPNGFEPDPVPEQHGSTDPARGKSTGRGGGESRDQFVWVFTGTLAQMPDTEVFLEALHELFARRPEARRRLRARFVGAYEAGYADRATALGLTGIVEFLGPRPHAEARDLQRRADGLLLWKPRGIPTMVPGKLYEYSDAGHPILALLDPDEEAAVLARGAGAIVVRPGDRVALATAIERLYDQWCAGQPIENSRPIWLDNHTRAALSRRLAASLNELVSSEP